MRHGRVAGQHQAHVALRRLDIEHARAHRHRRAAEVEPTAHVQPQLVSIQTHRSGAGLRQHQGAAGVDGQHSQIQHRRRAAGHRAQRDVAAGRPQRVDASAAGRSRQLRQARQHEAVGVAGVQTGIEPDRHRAAVDLHRACGHRRALLQRHAVGEAHLGGAVHDQPAAVEQGDLILEHHLAGGVDDDVAADEQLAAERDVHRVEHVEPFQRRHLVHAQCEAGGAVAGAPQVAARGAQAVAGPVARAQRLQRHVRDLAAADHHAGGGAAAAAARKGHALVDAIGIALAARGHGDTAQAVAHGALQQHGAALGPQVQHVVRAQPAVDALGDGEVPAAGHAGAQRHVAGQADRVVDEQPGVHCHAGAVVQRGRGPRAVDRQRLGAERTGDLHLPARARGLDDERAIQVDAAGRGVDRDRVGAAVQAERQRGHGLARQGLRVQRHAGPRAQGDQAARVARHQLQAAAGVLRGHQGRHVHRAGGLRRDGTHRRRARPLVFQAHELAVHHGRAADVERDAARREVALDHQLRGLDAHAGGAEVDVPAVLRRLQAHALAHDLQRAQGLVPMHRLDPADQLAAGQAQHLLAGRRAGGLEHHRQRVVGQVPCRGLGLAQAQRALGRGLGRAAQVQRHVVRTFGAHDAQGRVAELEDLQLIGQGAQADAVQRRAVHAQAVARGGEDLEAARVVGGLHREGRLLLDRDLLRDPVEPVLDRHRQRAAGALGARHELHVAGLRQQRGDLLLVAAQAQHAVRFLDGDAGREQRDLGDVDVAAAVALALDLREHQLVVLVGRGVVEAQRAHRALGVAQQRGAGSHGLPAAAVPGQLLVGAVQGIGLRVPLRDVVVGARGQPQLRHRLGRRQRHHHAAAHAVEVQVLGVRRVVERALHLLVGRAVGGGRHDRDHRHPSGGGRHQLRARLLGELHAAAGGGERDRHARRIGVEQRALVEHQVGGLVAGGIQLLRQHQVGRGAHGRRGEAEQRLPGRGRDDAARGRIDAGHAPVGAGSQAGADLAPARAAVARDPHAAAAAIGGGRQRLAVAAHPHRGPGRGRARGAPLPVGGAGVGHVDHPVACGRHQLRAGGVHRHGHPVGVVERAAGGVLPAQASRGIDAGQVQAAADGAVGRGGAGRQQALAVGAGGHGAPVGVGPGDLLPAVAGRIEHPHLARRVALAPVEDVPEVPLPAGDVGDHHAAVAQQLGGRVVVVRRAAARFPGQAAVVRQREVTAVGEGGDGQAVGRDRDRVVAAARGRAGRRPGGAAVAREEDALLAAADVGHGHRQLAGHREVAPVLRHAGRGGGRDHRARLAALVVLAHLHRQHLAVLAAREAVAHAARGREVGVEVGQLAGEGGLGRAAARHRDAAGVARLEGTRGDRQRDRGHALRIAAAEGRADEQQPRAAAAHGREACGHRHRGRPGQRPDDAQHRRRQRAGEVHGGRLPAVLGDGVDAQRAGEDVGVLAVAADELVDAQQRVQRVVAAAAHELVVAAAAPQHVVAQAAVELVAPAPGDQHHRRLAGSQRAQDVVALGVHRLAAALAQQDRVVARPALGVDDDVGQQPRGVEHVVAVAEVHHHLLDVVEDLVEALVLHRHQVAVAADDEGFGRIRGVEVEPLAGARAGEQREHPVLDAAQHRLDRRRGQVDLAQVDAEDRYVDAVEEAQLAPDVAVEVRLEAEVEQVQRPAGQPGDAARIGHQRQRLRGAHLAVAHVVHAHDLAVLVARDGAALDVVEVGLRAQRQARADAALEHPGDAHAALEADLDRQAQLGLLLAARAGLHDAVLEGRQRPVVDVETIDDVQRIAAGHRLLDAVGVEAEGQVREGADAAEGVDREADGQRHRAGGEQRDGRVGDLQLEVGKPEVQLRQLVGEQRGVAAAEDLGPVRDVGQVGHELQP